MKLSVLLDKQNTTAKFSGESVQTHLSSSVNLFYGSLNMMCSLRVIIGHHEAASFVYG